MQARMTGAAAVAALASLALVACSSEAADTPAAGTQPDNTAASGEEAWTPERAVSFVVPANAGGGQDVMARAMANGLQAADENLNIAVENRPGGSSAVGYTFVQQQEGNPHVLITATISLLSLPLTTDLPYTWESFTPIAMIGEDLALAVVSPESEWETLPDIVESAATEMVRVGVAGQDSPDALTLDLLQAEAGVTFQEVVFQSGAEVLTALMAGDIDFAIPNPSEVAGQLESGDVRPLAVFGEERYAEESGLGDIPTAAEQGLDVALGQLRGVVAAPGITDAQRDYWSDLVEEYTKSPEYEQYVEASKINARFLPGEGFGAYLAEQEALLVEAAGDD